MQKIKLNRVPLIFSENTVTLKSVYWNMRQIIPPAVRITRPLIEQFGDIAEYIPVSVKPGPGVEDIVIENIRKYKEQKNKKKLENIAEEYKAGSVIFHQGDTAPKDCYILIEGKVDVIVNGIKIASITDVGKPIGEMSFLSDIPRTATIICAEHTKLLRLKYEDKSKIFKMYPNLISTILETLVDRLSKTSQEKAILQKRFEESKEIKKLYQQIEDYQKTHSQMKETLKRIIRVQKGISFLATKVVNNIQLILGRQTKDIKGAQEVLFLIKDFAEYLQSLESSQIEVAPYFLDSKLPESLKSILKRYKF